MLSCRHLLLCMQTLLLHHNLPSEHSPCSLYHPAPHLPPTPCPTDELMCPVHRPWFALQHHCPLCCCCEKSLLSPLLARKAKPSRISSCHMSHLGEQEGSANPALHTARSPEAQGAAFMVAMRIAADPSFILSSRLHT